MHGNIKLLIEQNNHSKAIFQMLGEPFDEVLWDYLGDCCEERFGAMGQHMSNVFSSRNVQFATDYIELLQDIQAVPTNGSHELSMFDFYTAVVSQRRNFWCAHNIKGHELYMMWSRPRKDDKLYLRADFSNKSNIKFYVHSTQKSKTTKKPKESMWFILSISPRISQSSVEFRQDKDVDSHLYESLVRAFGMNETFTRRTFWGI
jgi:hypothetical protein